MDWQGRIFAYCERGLDPGFWAEPLNAVSNAAFLVAAALACYHWREVRDRRDSSIEAALIGLVGVIGIGSFLFHTLATRWAVLADTIPIGLFMLFYLGYALRALAGLGWVATGAALAVFVAALWGAEGVRCGEGPCLNGSLGYIPALIALAAIGTWLRMKRHPGATALLSGTTVFLVSLSFRTFDRAVCPATALLGTRPLGTHFIWHILNATLLYMLLSAAIAHRASVTSSRVTPSR